MIQDTSSVSTEAAAGDPPGRASSAATRNLLIVHTPQAQDVSDWIEVRRRIGETAPDIEVRIATNGQPNSVTRRWQGSRPSLVFSPYLLQQYEPKGGTVYSGRRINKIEQAERFVRHDLPVPQTEKLTPGLTLDPARWGDYVIVKPLRGGAGRGIRLLRTLEVAARYGDVTSNGSVDMLVQPYLEHSENGAPTEYRVLTAFGRALYALRGAWARPRGPLDDIAADPNGVIASNYQSYGRVRSLCYDPDIIALGERAYSAFRECPVLGVDILRDLKSGQLYIMEVNPAGDTWHFSSTMGQRFYAPDFRKGMYSQFDALNRVAEALIEKTRAEAS